MQIKIAGYLAASHLLEHEPVRWHSLIILGEAAEATGFAESKSLSCHYLHFDDVDLPQPEKITPTADAIRRGLEFASGKDALLVSCRAGQGRSAAIAYLVGCQALGPSEALSLLDPTRHSPNRLVVKLGASVLGDPAVLERFDAWRRSNAGVRLSDHYDRMEAEFEALERRGARDLISVARRCSR